MTKLRRERYLQSRRVTAELLSTTTRTDELQSGDFKGGSVSIGDVQKERGWGSAASFIGRASAVEEETGVAQFTRCHCGLMEPLMAPFTRRVKPPLKAGAASLVSEEGGEGGRLMSGPDRIVVERGRVGAGAAWMWVGHRLGQAGHQVGPWLARV